MDKFKKIFLITITVISLFLGLGVAYAGPIMEFKDTAHDFGEVDQGKSFKHVFTFKNAGDEDLEILEVKPSCGCTAALLSSKIIKPGETGELEVTFNSGKFKNKVRKIVNIETNEEPMIKREKVPGTGPTKTQELRGPSRIRKLHITATVKYNKKKEDAIKRAREASMKRSKETTAKRKADQGKPVTAKRLLVQVPLRGPVAIDHNPKALVLGAIKVNNIYSRKIKLINMTNDAYGLEQVTVSMPYVSAMITNAKILQGSPGEVMVTINVKEKGVLNDGRVDIYIKGNPLPITVPMSWTAN